jgi:predicted metal-dependent hydrolase
LRADTTANRTILQGGRAKAYRPLPPAKRRAAIQAGLEAYDRGDYFLAHELLEPAWMGTKDIPERELLQGLIKLAAAFVHAARRNPKGIAKNLRGARERLMASGTAGDRLGIHATAIIQAIDGRLEAPLDARDPAIGIDRLAPRTARAMESGPG